MELWAGCRDGRNDFGQHRPELCQFKALSVASSFLHELTQSWQIAHSLFDSVWMAQELSAQLAGPSSCNVGPAGPPFGSFGPEAQAMIVRH